LAETLNGGNCFSGKFLEASQGDDQESPGTMKKVNKEVDSFHVLEYLSCPERNGERPGGKNVRYSSLTTE
jgi:hypothetical protein